MPDVVVSRKLRKSVKGREKLFWKLLPLISGFVRSRNNRPTRRGVLYCCLNLVFRNKRLTIPNTKQQIKHQFANRNLIIPINREPISLTFCPVSLSFMLIFLLQSGWRRWCITVMSPNFSAFFPFQFFDNWLAVFTVFIITNGCYWVRHYVITVIVMFFFHFVI